MARGQTHGQKRIWVSSAFLAWTRAQAYTMTPSQESMQGEVWAAEEQTWSEEKVEIEGAWE